MKSTLFAGAALALLSTPAFAAYETLTSSGTTVLKECQGVQEPAPDPTPPAAGTCAVNALPGTGWTQVRNAANKNIVANGTIIGRYTDTVWQKNGTNTYVLGIRLSMNSNLWTPPAASCADTTPISFEVNDVFRTGFSHITTVKVAYKQPGSAEEGVWLAGRTSQGLGQYASSPYGVDPARDNNSVAFRTDVNVDDPDGNSKANSAWMLIEVAANGISAAQTANAIRLWQGGEEGQCQYSLQLPGYTPN